MFSVSGLKGAGGGGGSDPWSGTVSGFVLVVKRVSISNHFV